MGNKGVLDHRSKTLKKHLDDFYKMKVYEISDKRVWDLPVVTTNAPIDDVLTLLCGNDHVWVVRDRKSMVMVGIITEKDFLDIVTPSMISTYHLSAFKLKSLFHGVVLYAKQIMSKKKLSVTKDHTVSEVLDLMQKYHFRRLPILEGKKLAGEVTLHNLIYKYYEITTQGEVRSCDARKPKRQSAGRKVCNREKGKP